MENLYSQSEINCRKTRERISQIIFQPAVANPCMNTARGTAADMVGVVGGVQRLQADAEEMQRLQAGKEIPQQHIMEEIARLNEQIKSLKNSAAVKEIQHQHIMQENARLNEQMSL